MNKNNEKSNSNTNSNSNSNSNSNNKSTKSYVNTPPNTPGSTPPNTPKNTPPSSPRTKGKKPMKLTEKIKNSIKKEREKFVKEMKPLFSNVNLNNLNNRQILTLLHVGGLKPNNLKSLPKKRLEYFVKAGGISNSQYVTLQLKKMKIKK